MLPEITSPALDTSAPVLILGGKENSLAVARNLGRHGIAIRVSGPANCWGMYSRYCRERFAIPAFTPPGSEAHEVGELARAQPREPAAVVEPAEGEAPVALEAVKAQAGGVERLAAH